MAVEIAVQLGTWDEVRAQAAPIRFEVFVTEQKVPADMELDEWDAVSMHALAFNAHGRAVGTGRLLADGHIGRMAVLADARGNGVGTALLEALIDEARRRGIAEVALHAQTHAASFYRRLDFSIAGEEYYDAGIPHVTMTRKLSHG